ncbi:MAG TPA: hypothetical protein PLO51_05745 [Candidatus Micrarchaeota archaeon]|nr:hypothetical protein [Candidatus Micrarchaeota archaeon]
MSPKKQEVKDGHMIACDSLGREVVFTAERAARPHDFSKVRYIKTQNPQDCFFCPGNEAKTPPEIEHVPAGNGQKIAQGAANRAYWKTRCFENKFPSVRPQWAHAYGYHEIMLETPRHDLSVSEIGLDSWVEFLKLASRRMAAHMKDPKIKYTIIFKNEGRDAGASLEHTHSQIVSLPFVPSQVKKYLKNHAKEIARNLKHQENLFYENSGFACLCPETSLFHYEAWVVPKKAIGGLDAMQSWDIESLADAMLKTLARLDKITTFAPYNIAYIMAPKGAKRFRMSVRIMPRLATWAGFEMGCGAVMNSILPDMAAKEYRETKQ